MQRNKRMSTSGRVFFYILCGFMFGVFWFIIAQSGSALAQGAGGLTMTVKAGFDGKFKDGQWIPVRVTLENNGADLQGIIKVKFLESSAATDTYQYPIELPSVSRKEIVIYVISGGYSRTLEVSLNSGKNILEKVQLQLDNYASTDLWYGILSSNPSAYNILSQLSTTNSTARTLQLEIGDIPERVHVLKSIDVLVFSGIDTGKLTDGQRQALIEWTAAGGRLILTGGADWQKTVAGLMDSEMLADMLPLIPVDSQTVKNLEDLQRFSRSSEPFFDPDQGIVAATGNLTEGAQVLVKANEMSTSSMSTDDNDIPLVLRKRYGAGEVLYLTFDPSQPTLKNWDGREDFFRSLLSNPLDKPSWLLGIRNWMQAKEAALTLPNLSLPSPLLICGFLGLYILALGPFNYFLVRTLRMSTSEKRSEWGWVTIPVMVICFSVLIILVGSISRGSQVILNRLAVVQVWPDIPYARVDGVMGIYSPTRSTYQAETNTPTLLHPLPSDYGTPTGSYTIQETGAKTIISGLKLEISGIEPLAFEGSTPAPTFKHDLGIELGPKNAILQGSLTNTSSLILKTAVLLFPGGTIQIGDFSPGETFQVQEQLSRAQLAGEPNLNPTFPYTTNYYGFPAPYSSPSDTTVSDILGTSNYYNDRETYRKYSILSAVTNSNYGTGSSRGSGVYLVGWSDQLPIEVNLSDTTFKTQDNILYVITFRPVFQTSRMKPSDGAFTMTPGTFNWSLLEGNDPSISPYSASIYPGTAFSIQFTPIQPVEFSKVKSLVLHLEGQASGSSVTGISVSAWDYNQNKWDELDDLRWGDNYLGIPEHYVGTNGSLRLNFASGQVSGIQITRADFTLELEK